MTRGLLLAWLVGCGTPSTGPVAPPIIMDARVLIDTPPVVPDASIAPAPAFLPRPPDDQLRTELVLQGPDWVRRTYGPPTDAAIAACETECGELSRAANEHAERDQLRRLGCARVSCEHDCAIAAVADFRCH